MSARALRALQDRSGDKEDASGALRAAAPAYAPEEAQQVGVPHHLAALVAHGPHELEQPDGGICRRANGQSNTARAHTLARGGGTRLLEAVQKRHATRVRLCLPTARHLLAMACMSMRLPTGSSSCHRFWTPMALLLQAALLCFSPEGGALPYKVSMLQLLKYRA